MRKILTSIVVALCVIGIAPIHGTDTVLSVDGTQIEWQDPQTNPTPFTVTGQPFQRALRMTISAATPNPWDRQWTQPAAVALSNGATYRLSIWMRTGDGRPGRASVMAQQLSLIHI
jgi:hypothetical protein